MKLGWNRRGGRIEPPGGDREVATPRGTGSRAGGSGGSRHFQSSNRGAGPKDRPLRKNIMGADEHEGVTEQAAAPADSSRERSLRARSGSAGRGPGRNRRE